jgi:hypothetical protein
VKEMLDDFLLAYFGSRGFALRALCSKPVTVRVHRIKCDG